MKSIRWMLAMMLVIVCGNAWGDNRVVIAPMEHGGITLGNVAAEGEQTVTLTVAPDAGYYITASDISVKKTAGAAHSRQNHAPGYAEDISVSAAQTDATGKGTYTFVLPDGYGAYVEAVFTECIAITPSVSIDGWTYGSTANTPSVSGNTGNGQVTFTYAVKGSTDFGADVPANAGDYTVKATIAAAGHYKGGEATADFTIAQAQLTSATLDKTSLTYNGSELTVNVSSVKAGELTVPAECYQVSGNTQTNVGTYTVTVTAKAGGNYDGSATAKFSITKAEADVTAPTAKENLVYNATAQALIEAGSTKSGEMQYSLDGTTYAATIPAGTDAGTYTVYYKVKGDGNHNDSEPASVTVEIAKAELTSVTIDATSSLTYTGTEQTVNVTGVTAGTLKVSASDYTVEGNKGTNVGNYTVTVTAKAEAKNFKGSATTDWSIVAADAKTFDVTLDPTEFTYDGTAKTPVVTVKDGSAVLTENTDYTLAYTNNINAGTAKVTVTGKGNYSGTQEKTFTIEKAELTAATLTKTSLTYTGSEQEVTVATVSAGELTVPATDYTVTGNTATNVGNYKATITANAETNFTGSVTVDWTITPASAEDRFTIELEYTSVEYDGTEKTPAVTVKDGSAVLTADQDYTVAYSDNVQAGTAKVTVTGMGNYTGEKTAEFTITKRSFVVEAEETEGGQVVPGVSVDVTVDEEDKTATIYNLNVPTTAEGENLTVHIPATLGTYAVTTIASGAISNNVTDIYMPDTEKPIEIEAGAFPGTATIHTTLALLDDYALMASLKDNYEGAKVVCTVTPVNKYWTLGTGCDVIIPDGIAVYTVQVKNTAEVATEIIPEEMLKYGNERIIKANNGVLLLGTAGQSYDLVAYSGRIASGMPVATSDNKDYGSSNCLEPVIEKKHYESGYYFVLQNNEFHSILVEGDEVKVPAGKAVLHLGNDQAGARSQILKIEGEATGINVVSGLPADSGNWYDLNGRKLQTAPTKKGIYIQNGRKVVVK